MTTIDKFRNFLAMILIGAFIGTVVVFVFRGIPTENKDLVTYMVGQLSGMATSAVAQYFTKSAGQDTLDRQRADTTGKMADAIVAAAQSTPPGVEEIKASTADAVANAATDKADQIKGNE